MRDELVDFLEAAGIEQEIDPLAGGQFPGVVLPPRARLAAALLGKPLEGAQSIDGREIGRTAIRALGHTLAVWAFSQSLRNFSSPMSVSGCLKHASMTDAGHVQMSAPMRAASTMCMGDRTLATRISVLNP